MPVGAIVDALLTLVLQLVDRSTAKSQLDRLAVRLANAAADEIEKAKFGEKEQPPGQN